MCGFCVWINLDKKVDTSILEKATNLLNHRGPDSNNAIYYANNKLIYKNNIVKNNSNITLGMSHRRLSIIDTSNNSNQPMLSKDEKFTFAYNGEVYNYIELRKNMNISEVQTNGDTEVLFKLLINNEYNILNKVNGMWAFAFFDKENKKLILSRDRFGKKPLFYYQDEKNFVVASEIKVIFKIIQKDRLINNDFLAYFLLNKRWPNDCNNSTFYKDIKSIEAGEVMSLDINTFEKESFYIKNKLTTKTIKDEKLIFDKLYSAVQLRLRADVKIGVLISGGVDSSIVTSFACLSNKVKNNLIFYTIKELSDDFKYAKILAKSLGIKLRVISMEFNSDKEFTKFVNKSAEHFEVPINYSVVSLPSYIIYKEIAKDGVKVVIDGTGGDEIFSCYDSDLKTIFLNNLNNLKLVNFYKYYKLFYRNVGLISKLANILKLILIKSKRVNNPNKLINNRYNLFRKLFKKNFLSIFNNQLSNSKILKIDNLYDMHIYLINHGMLKNFLVLNDRYSMMNSIEVRSPLLDYRLFSYIKLPLNYKYNKGYSKYILRKVMPKNVPDKLRWRKTKQGFASSGYIKLNKIYYTHMISEIKSSKLLNKIIDVDELVKNFDNKYDDVIDNLHSLAVLDNKYKLKI